MQGRLRFTASGAALDLAEGEIVMLAARVTPSVEALDACAFLLTVALPN